MIHLIIAELKRNRQALSINDLSQKLEIDNSVLEGMVTTLVRRGYLVEELDDTSQGPCECGCHTCPRRTNVVPNKTYRLGACSMERVS